MSEINEINVDEAVLHHARGVFLDAFADLELSVIQFLRKLDAPFNDSGNFAPRLKAFRELKACSSLPAKSLARRDKIADEIGAILQLRADIVHSRMEMLSLQGAVAARFTNVLVRHEDFPPCRILTIDDFNSLQKKLKSLCQRIAGLALTNPASSPPPPSPDAAGGP